MASRQPKKIRVIESVDDETTKPTDSNENTSGDAVSNKELMKYLEAIDWKLWEMLKTFQRIEKKLVVVDLEEESDDNNKDK